MKNVVLVDPVITAQATSGEQYVGTLVGYVSRCVKIDDNTVIGGSVTITGVSNNDNSVYAGGLVGYYFNGDWPSLKRNIVSGTTVSGAGVSGGLVGRLYYSYCVDQNFVDATVSSVQHTSDAGTFYRQGAVVGECYSISNNSSYFTWGYYHNTAGLTFFAKDENGNTKNDQPKTSRIYAVGIVPSDITVSGDGYHGFCGKHYCLSGASITLSGGTAPAGYLLNGYTSTDATITNGTFTMPAKDITVSATFTPDPAHIEQTATDEYTIHSAEGWGVFCDMLQDNATYNRFIGKTVKLDANIGTAENPITRMAGSSGHEFFGTFDGQQHTLTFSYGATGAYGNEQYVAPFRYVSGDNEQNPAIIQNLHVTGHIYTSTKYATGILAQQNGTVKIKNCHSSIVIHSSVSGDGSHGGLVGGISGTLSIDGCVFDGKLLTTGTTATNNCGGFVGWNGGTLTISNSLYAPAIIDTEHGEKEVVVGTSYPSATFSRNGATITNSYYTRTLGTAQGKAARSITAGDYVTIEAVSPIGSPVENGTYSVSGITAYAKGITRGDAFYYGNGDEVSLTLSHADRGGYTFTGYAATSGTFSGDDNPYALTMPGDGDVTINANYEFIKFTQGALSYECTSGTEVKVTACDNSLTSVTIPATVTYDEVTYTVTAIGNAAFAACTSLTTVFMQPTTPPTLGDNAFANCDELANIYVPAASLDDYKGVWADYASKIQGYDGTCGDNVYWSYNSTSHKLTIFGTGAMADNYPWYNYRYEIMTVDIREGVTSIGQLAFNGCTALGSITVASGNTIYDSRNDCNALIETASNTLIQGCVNTVIPNTVTSIGSGAFYECFDLKEITIPASVTTIGGDAFAFCKDLTSIEIPASVTTIGDGAFDVCEGLTSITISEGVTSIGDAAFAGCTSLTNITIPASVTSIGDYAFQECTGLTTVFMVSTTPPTLGYIVFNVCKALDAIYVPTDKVDDYKTAWADYKDKIKGLDEITEIALADNASNSDLIAAVNGQTHNVTLQGRTLVKDGNWNTLCLPFDVDLTDTESPLYGATVKKLNASASGLSGSTLTLAFEAETTTLHAGVPYIIKWTETGENIVNPTFTGVTISSTEPTPVTSTDGKVTFVGQYSPFEIVESGATGDNQGNKNEIIMLSSGNKLGYSKNPRTLHTFRCHFYIPTNDSQQQARSFVLDFGEGETTTGIISMSDGRSQMSDGWYDLQGRKLDKQPAKKGLYIMNGKKVKR